MTTIQRCLACGERPVNCRCPEWAKIVAERDVLSAENEKLRAEVEQLGAQLAACGLAAMGYGGDIKPGDHGWSASFGDVMKLRAEVQRLRGALEDWCHIAADALQATESETSK